MPRGLAPGGGDLGRAAGAAGKFFAHARHGNTATLVRDGRGVAAGKLSAPWDYAVSFAVQLKKLVAEIVGRLW